MSKTYVSPYQVVVDRIVADLEQGVALWAKPWSKNASGKAEAAFAGFPMNIMTGKQYRGGNVFALIAACLDNGWQRPAFATYKQIAAAGGNIVKGSKATRIAYSTKQEKEPKTDYEKAHVNKDGMFVQYIEKGYNVFNVEQTEGLTIDEAAIAAVSQLPEDTAEFIDSMGASVRHRGNVAAYAPLLDHIVMPIPEAFKTLDDYRSTLYHEVAHWTGHASRLNRPLCGNMKDPKYAFEELIAELSSAFVCYEFGIEAKLQHSEYIGHWIEMLKGDVKVFQKAATAAQKVLDWVREKAGQTTSAEEIDMREAA